MFQEFRSTFAETWRRWGRTTPEIRAYLVPDPIYKILIPSVSNEGESLSMLGGSDSMRKLLLERLSKMRVMTLIPEMGLCQRGIALEDTDYDAILNSSSFSVSFNDARNFSEMYENSDLVTLISDNAKHHTDTLKESMVQTMAQLEVSWMDREYQRELVRGFQEAVTGNELFGNVQKIFGDNIDFDTPKGVSELLGAYIAHKMCGDDADPLSSLMAMVVMFPEEGKEFENSEVYQALEGRVYRRMMDVDLSRVEYFPGITPDNRKFPQSGYSFTEAQAYFREHCRDVVGAVMQALMFQESQYGQMDILTSAERATNITAHYAFRKGLELHRKSFEGDLQKLGTEILEYNPFINQVKDRVA